MKRFFVFILFLQIFNTETLIEKLSKFESLQKLVLKIEEQNK
jgi:hypothetical protein